VYRREPTQDEQQREGHVSRDEKIEEREVPVYKTHTKGWLEARALGERKSLIRVWMQGGGTTIHRLPHDLCRKIRLTLSERELPQLMFVRCTKSWRTTIRGRDDKLYGCSFPPLSFAFVFRALVFLFLNARCIIIVYSWYQSILVMFYII
jgi:hypothetical protein